MMKKYKRVIFGFLNEIGIENYRLFHPSQIRELR